MYKLLEPKKTPLADRLPFYFFAGFLMAFMYWLIAIHPTQNGNWATWGAASSKPEWIVMNTIIFMVVGFIMIPVVRNGNMHDYALAKLWANRDYLEDGEFGELCDMLKPNIIKDNGAKAMLRELQRRIDSHEGRHIAGHKYFKKEYIKDLQKV